MPNIPPLAAIAQVMREKLERPKAVAPQGEYHCSRCSAELLQNPVTMLWESEEELDLCPARPGKSYGVHHSPSIWAKPKNGEDENGS